MNRRTRLLVVATFAAGLALAVGTGGFSAVNADRGISAAVVEDPNAYLGVEIEVEETDDGSDGRKGISFVGFCGTGGESIDANVTVVEYKTGEDPREDALAVDWTTTTPVSTVVLKTGGGRDALENFTGGTSGTAEIGDGAPAGDDQETVRRNYCPDGEEPLSKVESDDFAVADDATTVGGDGDRATITITNQFAEGTVLDLVEVVVSGPSSTTETIADLEPGESETLTFEVDCDGTVVADVEATGTDVEVDLEPRPVC